ncbi:hypothetical protein GCM10022393_04530 [Aquimarina addita]|uniref:Calx-beta domain-containing protein n=1 Tax=Aquimarina addita TaxID=870485 RepID=A0ABP7XC17_9FLAO
MILITSIRSQLLIIPLIVLLPFSTIFGQDIYQDNFNGGANYANSSGITNWPTSWVESGEGTNANGGKIRINNNQLRFRQQGGGTNISARNISRAIDLSPYSDVILTLDYNRTNGNETIAIQLWNNNTSSWNTVLTTGGGTGSLSHTLTADQISVNSAIRLLSGSGGWNNNETIFINDVQFEGTLLPSNPEISIDDVTENEDAGTIDFTVSHTGGTASGSFTIEFTTSDISANAPADYTAFTGTPTTTITFSGTSLSTQTISIPIVDDTLIETAESFEVNLSNPSDGSVTIIDTQGIGTINDNDGFIITNGTVNTCSGTFLDSGGLAGNYGNNESFTYTICPDTPGNSISVDFTTFNVETGFDGLEIFNDNGTANSLGVFDNSNIPGLITSTDGSGCLTFVFSSDVSVTGNWEATIGCYSSFVVANNITVNETDGTATFQVTYNGPATLGTFTVDYTTADNTAYAASDYTTVAGSLVFSTSVPGVPQLVTVPIINNNFEENDETFYLTLSNVSDPSIGTVRGTATIIDTPGDTPVDDDVPLTLFDNFNGYYDYALTAGTLRTADENVDPCAITTSSTNTLTTPILAGSTIEKAYLIWGHSGRAADDVVTFEGQSVTADVVNSTSGGFYYGMVSDVTTIIQGIADPSTNAYDFTDLVIDNSSTYCGSVVFGGWSLYIYYTNPTLPAVSINMYNGFDSQIGTIGSPSSTSYTLDGFFAIGSSGSKTSVLSWEGDRLRTGGEIISVTTGSGTTNLTGDGNNSPTLANVFNSTIYDDTASPTFEDTSLYGFDLDTYDISSLITQGETTATTNVATEGDFIILNSVLLKVPSNLMTGTVFEDINYPGGVGRDLATSSGLPVEDVRVELYDNTGTLIDFDITDATGTYSIGGMANGTYSLRVVNNTVESNRGGGTGCTNCIPVQTYRSTYTSSTLSSVTNEVGGANPAGQDVGSGILTGAQTISEVTILNEGAVGLDFGFNFNTIVNTNENGQGSLEQFIVNTNNLDEVLLDIDAHPNNGTLDPAAGEDVSIFNIPTSDGGFTAGSYFDIFISNTIDLTIISDDNTSIDGRSQTALTGNTNAGTTGAGGSLVGVSQTALPNYDLPEIQIHQNNGNVLRTNANNITIRNTALYANNNSVITVLSGSSTIFQNLIGVNALGVFTQNKDYGVEINGGTVNVDSNYIADNTDAGIYIDGSTSVAIQNNHITTNGDDICNDNITIVGGSGISIQNNLIENASAFGIDDTSGNVVITDNTITNSGQDITDCSNNSGIHLTGNNTTITNNRIHTNGGSGIALEGGNTNGNLISQNSIYANGTVSDALGIDIGNDGVTINDNGDTDNGPNGSLNFPVFESITIQGTILKIIGWSRPGATIELFLTDISQGTASIGNNQLGLSQDYGEGQIFIGSVVEGSVNDSDGSSSAYNDPDGNQDNTNKFNFSITLSNTIPLGTLLTATATIANTTSEFANTFPVRTGTLITNRRITYRVTPTPVTTGGPTGTPTTDMNVNFFDDGQFGPGNSYQLQVQNTTGTPFNYEIWIQNVPYASIPGLNLGNHTLNTVNNGDGTYSYLFTSTVPLGAFQSAFITGSGGAPSPPGTGVACGCVSFYKL